MSDQAITKTVRRLVVVVAVMFGFGYALVPMYNVFCQATGFRGKTGEISAEEANRAHVDVERWITVEFDTNVNQGLPWQFEPMQRRVRVHPGEIGQAMFFVRNVSSRTITGQAVPSVAPEVASIDFSKTECFCFSRQTLKSGQQQEMPVRFIVSEELPERITTITLSYTFFEVPDAMQSS